MTELEFTELEELNGGNGINAGVVLLGALMIGAVVGSVAGPVETIIGGVSGVIGGAAGIYYSL